MSVKAKASLKSSAATRANRKTLESAVEGSASTIVVPAPGNTSMTTMQSKSAIKMGPTYHRFQALGRYELLHYPTEVKGDSSLTNFQFLSLGVNYNYATPTDKAVVDLGAGTFFKKNQTEFAVYDLYWQNNFWLSPADSVSVGRKRLSWSDVDRFWNLGLWQPKFAMDPLRPKQQGLTGVFYEHAGENWFTKLNFSPLYIPNIGPDIREENGALVSNSRWYRPPSNQFVLFGKENNIYYNLDVGDVAKLVNNQGASAQVGYRLPSGVWFRSQYAYKPLNEILLTREEYKNINRSVNVTVRPKVAYHEIVGGDVGMDIGDVGVSLSALSDRPIEQRPEEGWAIQKPGPMQVYGVTLNYELQNFLRRDFQFQAGYLKVQGGDIVDIKADGSRDEITLFTSRAMFTNAVRAEVSTEIMRLRQQPLVTRTSLMYEMDQKGTLFNTQFEYITRQKIAVIMGADILSVENESEDPTFLNQFRANDRFYGGLSYDF